jgi:HEPN domain-containing protein
LKNNSLVQDYVKRAEDRLAVLEIFIARKSWANAVRESQEVVELSLKAYLRSIKIEVPRVHDVSAALEDNKDRLKGDVAKNLKKIVAISKALRRDRELAFYGTEDLTPSDFYSQEDAERAVTDAGFVFRCVKSSV